MDYSKNHNKTILILLYRVNAIKSTKYTVFHIQRTKQTVQIIPFSSLNIWQKNCDFHLFFFFCSFVLFLIFSVFRCYSINNNAQPDPIRHSKPVHPCSIFCRWKQIQKMYSSWFLFKTSQQARQESGIFLTCTTSSINCNHSIMSIPQVSPFLRICWH